MTKSTKAELDVTLATQTRTQQVSVTATATPTPIAQIGASVTVLTADDYRQYAEVQDPLRQIPGLQVNQIGQLGGTTGLSIRGGDTDANKVLIDDVPVNDIGGGMGVSYFSSPSHQPNTGSRKTARRLYACLCPAGLVALC